MQRRAQRDDQQRAERAIRTGGLNRVVAAALAVPVMVLAGACSSDSGSDSGSGDGAQGAATASEGAASAAPTVQAAAYAALPDSCKTLSKKTLKDLVPKGGTSGKEGTSSDTAARASCSWSSLDNNGVDGSQFRWLNVSLLRFESDQAGGTGEAQARTYYAKQVKDAQNVSGAKNTKAEPLAGTGDEATVVRYDLKKKEGAFKQQTVVALVENVVVTLDYNGAGLAGDETPKADTLTTAAKKAAKEVVASVRSANGEGTGAGSGVGSGDGGDSASKSPAPSASPSKTSSAAPSKTPAEGASKSAVAKS